VWDKVNCTDPTYIVYNASTEVNNTFSTGNVTCISFNERASLNSTNSTNNTMWSFRDFVNRYVQIRNSHADAYDKIKYYG
jgi:hypothetical protein